MPVVMRCPGCKTQFEFADELEGKRIKCKTCGDVFRVENSPARSTVDEEDDRPAVHSASRRRDDDDRPAARRRDDGDRPVSRYRRPMVDDEERPTSRSRRRDDDESDEDLPRRRRDEDDEDDEQPRKKKIHPLLIIGPIGALAAIAIVVVVILASKGKKKGLSEGEGSDLVKAPTKSCPLELPEKDLGTLVLPDSGNTFGFLRKGDTLKKTWTFDMYDLAAGRRVGRIDLTDMDEPRAISLSPDGKRLIVMEGPGFGAGAPTLSLWSVGDNKEIARKWNPYPAPAKAGFDAPSLYRAEFIGNDKAITLSTARFIDVWPMPAFEPKVVDGVAILGKGDHLGKDDRFGQNTLDKYQRQSAFSADHQLMAVWNGTGISVVGTADGQDVFSTGPIQTMAKEWWPRTSFLDQAKAGPMAFSPDGKILASIVTHEPGGKKHVLCLWDIKSDKGPDWYVVPTNQFNDAPAIYWWGNRFIVTHGSKVDGMIIDVRTGIPKRQLMGPRYSKYGFGRDGRLWYAISDELKSPATMYVMDGFDPDQLTEPDDYEQIMELKDEFFMRRLWLEKFGVMRKQSDPDPSLRQQRLIRRP